MIKALIAVAALLGLDQLVKLWTVNVLARMPGGEIQLWPGVFHLTYVQNRGAAFGMLQNQLWLFALATVVLVGGLIYVLWRMRRSGPAPVSYTHLDVYKRQMPSRPAGCSTAWWVTRSARCCGARCARACPPGGCSPSPPA